VIVRSDGDVMQRPIYTTLAKLNLTNLGMDGSFSCVHCAAPYFLTRALYPRKSPEDQAGLLLH
jgi:hypothetical protein